MAMGNLDINTLERIDDFNPDKAIPQVSDHNHWKHSWWSKLSITFHLEHPCKCFFSLLKPAVTAGMTQQLLLGPVSGAETLNQHVHQHPHPGLLPHQTGLSTPGERRESSAWMVWGCPAESCRWRDQEKVSWHAVSKNLFDDSWRSWPVGLWNNLLTSSFVHRFRHFLAYYSLSQSLICTGYEACHDMSLFFFFLIKHELQWTFGITE